jgi:hypothetical protein
VGSSYNRTQLNNVLWRHFVKGENCWGEGGFILYTELPLFG